MVFKKCTKCGLNWTDRKDFLADQDVVLAGYQSNFTHLLEGFFLFLHNTTDCGTTVAIPAGQFSDLHNGPIFAKKVSGTSACPGFCFEPESLAPCHNSCECAFVRNVLQIIKNWPKTPRGETQGST